MIVSQSPDQRPPNQEKNERAHQLVDQLDELSKEVGLRICKHYGHDPQVSFEICTSTYYHIFLRTEAEDEEPVENLRAYFKMVVKSAAIRAAKEKQKRHKQIKNYVLLGNGHRPAPPPLEALLAQNDSSAPTGEPVDLVSDNTIRNFLVSMGLRLNRKVIKGLTKVVNAGWEVSGSSISDLVALTGLSESTVSRNRRLINKILKKIKQGRASQLD